jgi:hypothetical protein
MAALIVVFWFAGGGVALRYLVLFIGVMSCMYVLWDIIGSFHSRLCEIYLLSASDDTIARKVNSSDASAFARVCGCCPSQGFFRATPHTILTRHSLGCYLAVGSLCVFCLRCHCWPGCVQGTKRSASVPFAYFVQGICGPAEDRLRTLPACSRFICIIGVP